MPGQAVVRRVAMAKKQEAETVVIIVRTLIQTINPTLEPVMRLTVSCYEGDCKLDPKMIKFFQFNYPRSSRILSMGNMVNLHMVNVV